jgi:EAL domain-containing protein (putative c-di-GMP-specific phosphodiesterase class I)/DNA-binding NarL/FixJ family response regulator
MTRSAITSSRILVVDDEEVNVRLIRRLLAREGFSDVRGVTDPYAGIELTASWEPDLIILDLRMPSMDGIEFLRAARDAERSTDFRPVLVLTGDTTRDALAQALRAGANDFLTKPVDADELQLRVRNLLSIRICHEELKTHNHSLARELLARTRFYEQPAIDQGHTADAVRSIIERGGPNIVFQPIVELATGTTVGVEALSRFGSEPKRTPDRWFADAASVGLGMQLEVAAIHSALRHLDELDSTWIMALNVSPTTILTSEFRTVLSGIPLNRISLEITEHHAVDDYATLSAVTGELRAKGALLAIDDAGAGYASLRHILKLRPDVIKLDIALTRDVDTDPIKRALAASLETFAQDIGAAITAEGIETGSELATLSKLGINYGQGYYIAHPGTLPLAATRRWPVSAR